jgi:hypothetical protein
VLETPGIIWKDDWDYHIGGLGGPSKVDGNTKDVLDEVLPVESGEQGTERELRKMK